MGIASLVISILAILTCLIPIFGAVLSFIALIIAIIAMCRKKNKEVNRGLKIAGLVISIVSFALSIFITVPLVVGAYIIAENNQELLDKAQTVITESDLANAKNACMVAWSEAIYGNDGVARDENGELVTAEYYYNYLVLKDFGTITELKKNYIITVNPVSGTPKVELNK